jgi:hypothetical protein
MVFVNNYNYSRYIDLERSLGTFETTKAAYKRTIELKVYEYNKIRLHHLI